MAILNNISNNTQIVLDLKKIKESPKWLGYELKVLIKQNNKTIEFLKLRNTQVLFFENLIEPEVPSLCNALDALANGEIYTHIFEPIDEKDFRLEIKKEFDFYRINLFLQEAAAFEVHPWSIYAMIGLQVKAEKDALINFSNELKKELHNLTNN